MGGPGSGRKKGSGGASKKQIQKRLDKSFIGNKEKRKIAEKHGINPKRYNSK